MRCAFPAAAVIASEADFIRMTAAISEPDQSDNYHFFERWLSFLSTERHQMVKKNKMWKIKITKKEKNCEPRNSECAMAGWRIINPFFGFSLINRHFFIYLLLPDLIDRSAIFFMDHLTSSKYVHNHAASLKWEKETWFLFVVNLVNHNICMLSSNDNVRQNEPQRAFWASVLKATGWQIHVGEQGRGEASSWLCATTTPAPHSQDLFSDRDSITSSGWHILMAEAHRKTVFLFKGVTAIFFITSNSTVTTIYQFLLAVSSNWSSMVKCMTTCLLFGFKD